QGLRLVTAGNRRGVPGKGLVNGHLAIGPPVRAVNLIPFSAHQAGSSKQAVNLVDVPPGPKHQEVAQRQVGGAIVPAVVTGVTTPQPFELVTVLLGIAGPTNSLLIRQAAIGTIEGDGRGGRRLHRCGGSLRLGPKDLAV